MSSVGQPAAVTIYIYTTNYAKNKQTRSFEVSAFVLLVEN